MTVVESIDPRTGEAVEEVAPESSADDVARACAAAADAAPALDALGRDGRARMLRLMADALEEDREVLVEVTDRETALGATRLNGELTRTTYQLRFFAEVLDDGGYLEATIDHAGITAMGPRPDLRRMLRPLGPVGVFGASNFPFAFSVSGGDTASALAAGCPVVVKAHESHPASSARQLAALQRGAEAAGAPSATVAAVFGRDAGVGVVEDPRITAVGFTGSVAGGRALHDRASMRSRPIPFYGELGALNALTVTPAAARDRAGAIGDGLAASFTLGVGQFCTKPGLALVPSGPDGDTLVAALTDRVRGTTAAVMLNQRTREGFASGTQELRGSPGVRVLVGSPVDPTAAAVSPVLLEADAGQVSQAMLEECFGPVLVVARYSTRDELFATLSAVGPALTATVHSGDDDELAAPLLDHLSARTGRVVWNGYPTGVAVSWAMHHGGVYPATTSPLHTSVGAGAIRRWLRPVSLQDVPAHLLPAELREDFTGIPRRVDGVLVV
ncbi:aldehyde dehydrogenase (NADP(+)) [Cellulomonas aerilata]|uniref:Aldehyde dehydrogenase n=1 Tax=Cellulomonas aerilata TaxID=515326 RepID=A0A512DFK8_9CELL|nr:aldehyde dehydrogenase (NADP(+)) [Cellulomonas aerilata]GEO35268.1 aldehyde dehydrogenase [Cellulomonas aerilata]